MKKIIFTGGGTLGHVMPNIYLMEELNGWDIAYIGSDGVEKNKLKDMVKYYEIPSTKFKRGKLFVNFKIPFILVSAIKKAKHILKEEKPDVLFSKGGYVSLPVCIAARKLKIPIITHESDYSFGLANRLILKFCNVMCVNFKNLAQKGNKTVYTGPIFSKHFENTNRNTINLRLDDNKKTILIVGGSLGSRVINNNIFELLPKLLQEFNIIHITGKGNLKVKPYKNYNAFEMTEDMINLYNIADFVIGRSGAGVTAECFYKKLPMLLIPLENGSSRGDQLQNATYYKDLGVAEILNKRNVNTNSLLMKIYNVANNLHKFKENYKKQTIVNGKQKVIELINKYAIKN